MKRKLCYYIALWIVCMALAFSFIFKNAGSFGYIFEENYDTGRFSKQWDTRGLCCLHSLQLVPTPTRGGQYAAKFNIKYSDPMVYHGKRAELVGWTKNVGFILGDDEWFGFSIFLPPDFDAEDYEDILVQWHARRDIGDIPRYPPIRLRTISGNWEFVAYHSSEEIQKTQGTPVSLWKDTYQTGEWNDWVVQVKWDYRERKDGGKGFVRIWRRREGMKWHKIVDYKGPNCYNDKGNICFQWGSYKPAFHPCELDDKFPDCTESRFENRVAYNDELRIAGPGHYLQRFHQVAPKSFSDSNSWSGEYDYHWLEAENPNSQFSKGDQHWALESADGYSASGAMSVVPNKGIGYQEKYADLSPRMDYKINFKQKGIYYVWVRGKAESNEDDLIHIGLNSQEIPTSDRIALVSQRLSWSNDTKDHVVAHMNIPSAGIHTLNVWMGEDGFVLDKLLITNDPFMTPRGIDDPAENFAGEN